MAHLGISLARVDALFVGLVHGPVDYQVYIRCASGKPSAYACSSSAHFWRSLRGMSPSATVASCRNQLEWVTTASLYFDRSSYLALLTLPVSLSRQAVSLSSDVRFCAQTCMPLSGRALLCKP